MTTYDFDLLRQEIDREARYNTLSLHGLITRLFGLQAQAEASGRRDIADQLGELAHHAIGKRDEAKAQKEAGTFEQVRQPLAARQPFERTKPSKCLDRDRSMRRKRRMGGIAIMPTHLLDRFTEGEKAVLAVIAADVEKFGSCTKTYQEIANRAGVSRNWAIRAVATAKRLGLLAVTNRPRPGRLKHETNIYEIVSPEWKAWLKRARVNQRVRHAYRDDFKKGEEVESVDRAVVREPSPTGRVRQDGRRATGRSLRDASMPQLAPFAGPLPGWRERLKALGEVA